MEKREKYGEKGEAMFLFICCSYTLAVARAPVTPQSQ